MTSSMELVSLTRSSNAICSMAGSRDRVPPSLPLHGWGYGREASAVDFSLPSS